MIKPTKVSKIPKKTRKTANPSTLNEKPTINDVWDEQYLCMFTLRQKPICDAVLEKWAAELLDWAKNCDDALKISQWCTLKGLSTMDLYRFCQRNQVLASAHQRAKEILGDRREMGALKKKYDTTLTAFMMPHYDKDWKEMAEWKAKINKVDDATTSADVAARIAREILKPYE